MGEVKDRTYWTKAWMSPTLMPPPEAMAAPMMQTTTYPTLPMKPMAGWIRPERNWDFQPAR